MIEIGWSEPYDGGSQITDYKVFWDQGVGNSVFTLKGTTDGYQTFTVTADDDGIVAGRAYSFKVSALNDIGEGDQSEAVSVIAASEPDTPDAPTLVSQSPSQIVI